MKGSVLPAPNRDDSPVVLTTESYEGQYHAELYNDKALALAKLEQMKEGKVIDPTYDIKNGFMITNGVMHRVQTLDEALSPDGKIVWRVSQKCFLPETFGRMDWDNYFTTREDAKELFDERAQLYRLQAEGQRRMRIEEAEDQMLVFLKGKPAIYLDFLARPVGEITEKGTVILRSFIK